MRKLIDIPDDLLKDLGYLAVDSGTSPKGWIEDLIKKGIKSGKQDRLMSRVKKERIKRIGNGKR